MGAAAAAVTSVMPDSCDPMDCSLPGSYIHGIFQARVLEWGAIAFSECGCYSGSKASYGQDQEQGGQDEDQDVSGLRGRVG